MRTNQRVETGLYTFGWKPSKRDKVLQQSSLALKLERRLKRRFLIDLGRCESLAAGTGEIVGLAGVHLFVFALSETFSSYHDWH